MKNIPHPTSPYFLHCYNPSLNQDNLSSAILHAASPLYHRSVGKILLIVSNITFALLKKLPCFLLSSEYNLKSLHWPQFWLHSHTVPLFHSPLATPVFCCFSATRDTFTQKCIFHWLFSLSGMFFPSHMNKDLFSVSFKSLSKYHILSEDFQIHLINLQTITVYPSKLSFYFLSP